MGFTSDLWRTLLARSGPVTGSPPVLRVYAAHGRLPAAAAAQLPRVLIVGEGGAGKSTLLKQMLARAAGGGRVPVWVTLSALPVNGPLTQSTLIEYLVEQARTRLGLDEVNPAFFEALVRDGQMAIGFDGLDECGALPRRQAVRGLIAEVAREWARCAVYVSSRPEALRETPLPLVAPDWEAKGTGEFFALAPRPFTRDDVAPFLKLAFDDGEALANQLLLRTGIEALVETPLTLTLVGLVARTPKGLPQTRTPLFARCLDTVCETWEDAKLGPPAADRLTPLQRLDVLRRLGWAAHCAGSDRLGARAAQAALAAVPQWAEPGRAQELVEGLARRNLLLRAETAGDGSTRVQAIRFAHPQFREYLAGAHLAEQFGRDEASVVAAMAGRWLDGRWLEVLRFAAATLDSEADLRDGLLRAALAAEDPLRDLLRRSEFLVARLLMRLAAADLALVAGIVAALERTALGEPALRDDAVQVLLDLAQHAPAQEAIERLACGGGVAFAFAADAPPADLSSPQVLAWRLRAIEALAASLGAAHALALLPALAERRLPDALAVCELRVRLRDVDGARAGWKKWFETDMGARPQIAASMDKAGEGRTFNHWLIQAIEGPAPTLADAVHGHERGLILDDAPVWQPLFVRAAENLASMEASQQFAPPDVSAAVYAALETGVAAVSPAGRHLVTAALRHPALVWFAGPHVRRALPELAAEAVQRLTVYVIDAQGPAWSDRSRVSSAVSALCEEPDDSLAVPALLELLRRADSRQPWARQVIESLRRRGQADAAAQVLLPRLVVPAGSDDRHPDADAAGRASSWQLMGQLDAGLGRQQLDRHYRGGDPVADAQRLIGVWNTSGVAALARNWFEAIADDAADPRGRCFLEALQAHERDTFCTDAVRQALGGAVLEDAPPPQGPDDAEPAAAQALEEDRFFERLMDRINEEPGSNAAWFGGKPAAVRDVSPPTNALHRADAWVQRALAAATAAPADVAEVLADGLWELARRGLHDPGWVDPVASLARGLAPPLRSGLLPWLQANARA